MATYAQCSNFEAAMFSDAEKTDIRRFCGYSAYGASPGGNMGWRFYTASGALEYRMNNLSAAEESVVRLHLATLTQLEAGVPSAAQNLDTEQAAVWTHNANEVADRVRLFQIWCCRLCGFLGGQPVDGLNSNSQPMVTGK